MTTLACYTGLYSHVRPVFFLKGYVISQNIRSWSTEEAMSRIEFAFPRWTLERGVKWSATRLLGPFFTDRAVYWHSKNSWNTWLRRRLLKRVLRDFMGLYGRAVLRVRRSHNFLPDPFFLRGYTKGEAYSNNPRAQDRFRTAYPKLLPSSHPQHPANMIPCAHDSADFWDNGLLLIKKLFSFTLSICLSFVKIIQFFGSPMCSPHYV